MRLLSQAIAFTAAAAIASTGAASAALEVGETAPDFTLPGSDDNDTTLSSFLGEQNVVLAFFPKAFTGGWTREMKGYQAGITQFIDSDAVVFGISTDPLETNKKFAESLGLEFALLSDEDGSVARSYGVLIDGPNLAKRATFVIDKEGKIAHVEEGMGAIDPAGAAGACGKLK